MVPAATASAGPAGAAAKLRKTRLVGPHISETVSLLLIDTRSPGVAKI